MFDIEHELKILPHKPGVYIMHDSSDKIIYVGKAVNLYNRVHQYFQDERRLMPKIQHMVKKIAWFEYYVVDSEMEALVLECNLIKEHMPQYNTMLKDDKGYPYIKITINERFPRIFIARERKKDKAKYFGPYTSGQAAKNTIELIQKSFGIRKCNKKLETEKDFKENAAPCLYYHIGQCNAPCLLKSSYRQGIISNDKAVSLYEQKYAEGVKKAIDFLNGKYDTVLDELRIKMEKASEEMEYEKALELRDLIFSIERMTSQQKSTDTTIVDRDIVGIAVNVNAALVEIMYVRNGKLLGNDKFYFDNVSGDDRKSVMTEFVKQYYSGNPYIPKEILLSDDIEERELIEKMLSEKAGRKVSIILPVLGEKERLVELACNNAMINLSKDNDKFRIEKAKTEGAVDDLANILGLDSVKRIESYDISNINGFENVGSMVAFENGKKKPSDYRKFKIKSFEGQDDYASLREVLTRRLGHEKDLSRYPDLILMDGGKGQIGIALEVMNELGIHIPVCGMVKDDRHRTRGLIFNNEELPLDTHSEVFHLITRIQDEVHRFAIEYHRSLRGKAQIHSILDDIDGIGDKRRRALMKHFGSIEEIASASLEELSSVPTMNILAAQKIFDFFAKRKSKS
ncbi:MAG: excinuclease ABC subunit UvrC [Lachnospiraceae bacterium]|nr:excinuclease ABC subunit UvrC [Lachnospiraceae bacterium]